MRLSVHVKPRSSRSKILGYREGSLEVAVQAPPVDGKANEELIELIAEALDVHRKSITVVAGQTGRQKVLEITGITDEAAQQALAAITGT